MPTKKLRESYYEYKARTKKRRAPNPRYYDWHLRRPSIKLRSLTEYTFTELAAALQFDPDNERLIQEAKRRDLW